MDLLNRHLTHKGRYSARFHLQSFQKGLCRVILSMLQRGNDFLCASAEVAEALAKWDMKIE
jgi:hypothetical protein